MIPAPLAAALRPFLRCLPIPWDNDATAIPFSLPLNGDEDKTKLIDLAPSNQTAQSSSFRLAIPAHARIDFSLCAKAPHALGSKTMVYRFCDPIVVALSRESLNILLQKVTTWQPDLTQLSLRLLGLLVAPKRDWLARYQLSPEEAYVAFNIQRLQLTEQGQLSMVVGGGLVPSLVSTTAENRWSVPVNAKVASRVIGLSLQMGTSLQEPFNRQSHSEDFTALGGVLGECLLDIIQLAYAVHQAEHPLAPTSTPNVAAASTGNWLQRRWQGFCVFIGHLFQKIRCYLIYPFTGWQKKITPRPASASAG